MPQFDFGNVFVPQLFWLAVFFVVLYFGIVRLTLPRLGKVMDERESKIEADLAEAQSAKEAADTIGESYRSALESSRETARQAMADAKEAAARAREARVAAADRQTDERVSAAEARIATARDEARASLRDVAIDSTRAIVTRLTGNEPDPAVASSAVDAAMARG